jgi:branched-chain amino acid transport system substrate-binding protein
MRFIKIPFLLCLKLVLPIVFLYNVTDAQENKAAGAVIKIGLLIQNSKALAAKDGAELAVFAANKSGGVNGLPVQLVIRSMEGPWGTGSKQAVSLIFDENVVAILGSHDGRNAHLVEQVSAKSRVIFLSAWSGDPTLAQAFVPWFFNCAYNDIQQADALIDEIYNRKKYGKIAVISDNSYDSGSTLKNFMKRVESGKRPSPVQFLFRDSEQNIQEITDSLKNEGVNCIVLFVQPPGSLKIIEHLKLNNLNQPVYCSRAQLDENLIPVRDLKIYEGVKFVTSVNIDSEPWISFREEYREKYGSLPGAVADCAFDGMNILIEAIRTAGTDREKLQKAMTDIKHEGVTGLIQFDDKGNRKGTPGLVELKNGIPVSVK